MRHLTVASVLSSFVLACSTATPPPASAPAAEVEKARIDLERQFSDAARLIPWRMTLSSFFDPARMVWHPGVQRSRGDFELFSRVAPSVFVVRTGTGHGTGFLVDNQGRIVTNHHVIKDGMLHDFARQGSYAWAYSGRVDSDGSMILNDEPVRAFFLKADDERDLALLQLERLPAATPIPLAPAPPRPGDDLSVLGHPSSGMLWTYRSGEVASVGSFPTDMMDFVMGRLFASDSGMDAADFTENPTRIVMSTAGANPGDSGGPAVDDQGRLVGVTFAGPADVRDDKFTYHVHVDEVRDFLAQIPAAPSLFLPDAWNFGPRVELIDVFGDARPDVLLGGTSSPDAYLFDLDNDSPRFVLVDTLVKNRSWDFEVAISHRGTAVHYDTDGDGMIDLIAIGRGQDEAPDALLVLSAGRWRQITPDYEPLLSPARLPSHAAAIKTVIEAM